MKNNEKKIYYIYILIFIDNEKLELCLSKEVQARREFAA